MNSDDMNHVGWRKKAVQWKRRCKVSEKYSLTSQAWQVVNPRVHSVYWIKKNYERRRSMVSLIKAAVAILCSSRLTTDQFVTEIVISAMVLQILEITAARQRHLIIRNSMRKYCNAWMTREIQRTVVICNGTQTP